MSLSATAARGALSTLSGQAVRFGLQIASVTVLARLLAPDDYGLFAMVFAVVAVAAVLGDFGLSLASIQSQSMTAAQRTNLFWTNAALGLTLSCLVFLSAQPLATFYGRPELVAITQAIAPSFLLNALAAQFRAEASVRLRFTSLAAADIVSQAAGLVAAVILAMAGAGYWALVAQQLIIAFARLPVLVWAARWWPGMPARGAPMRALYGFGANTLGVQVISYVTSNIDTILIGRVAGAESVGVYNRAYQLFRLPLQQIASPLTRVALPILSQIQDDQRRFESYVLRAQLLLTYAFGGLFFMLACTADPLVDILLGDQWGAAKPLFVILSIGGVFQAMGYVYYWIFVARARTGLQLRVTVVSRGLMIAAMGVGTAWGATGVAVGASIGQILIWVMNTWAVPGAGLRVGPLVRIAARPLVLYLVMTVLTLSLSARLQEVGAWTQAVALAAFMASYLAAAFTLLPPVRHDVLTLVETVRRARR